MLALSVAPALAADGLHSDRPMGFFGEGHASNHPHYDGLLNAKGNSCCNHADCRPTTAHWVGDHWEFMVDGKWRRLSPGEEYKVITAEVLAAQHRQRWDSQAHVCTTKNGVTIYCFMPPASGG